MSTGEPGLPRQFRWKSQTIHVAPQVLKTWRKTDPAIMAAARRYVRKHWLKC